MNYINNFITLIFNKMTDISTDDYPRERLVLKMPKAHLEMTYCTSSFKKNMSSVVINHKHDRLLKVIFLSKWIILFCQKQKLL